MKTRSLMAWSVLQCDAWIWKIIWDGAMAFDDRTCALLLVHKHASWWGHSLNHTPGGGDQLKQWDQG